MVNTFSPFLRGSVHRKLYRACAFSGMINCVINGKSSAWRNQIFQGSFSCIYGGIEKVYQCRASCFSRRLHGDNEVNVSEFARISCRISPLRRLTRICRAQFELQDAEESEILHRRYAEANRDTDTIVNHGNDTEKSEPARSARLHPAFSSWKLPSWFGFSLGRMQSSTKPLATFDSTGVTPLKLSPIDNVRRDEAPTTLTDGLPEPTTSRSTPQHSQVVPHLAPGPWDDQTMVDRPYNNPFYSRPIDNFLWLPRNPCATLDLDDTVDLRIPLGIQIPEIVSPTEPPQEAGTSFHRLTSEPLSNRTEETELPEVITKQIGSREGVVQHSKSIRSVGRQTTDASLSPRQHQSSTADKGPPHLNGRSLSDGINVRPPRTSERASLQLAPRIFRTRSVDIEQGTRRPSGYYETAKAPEDISQPQDIPAHQAIVHEVLAEEDLIRQLEEEKGNVKVTKSWLTSWMFTKAE